MPHATNAQPTKPAKANGRPCKNDPGRVPYHEVDRLLVFGQVIEGATGEPPIVVYPSYRDLGRRYRVNHSVIAAYSKKHDCLRRRETAQARVAARSDEKLIEHRASALAFGRAEVLAIIDGFVAGFEKALADGRVRCDNPTDFNTMLRLKEYLEGGPDSRQEVHAALSLDELQARHRQMLRALETSPAECGNSGHIPRVRDADPNPPTTVPELGTGKPTGHIEDDPFGDVDLSAAVPAQDGPEQVH